jgi:hypothetical protein
MEGPGEELFDETRIYGKVDSFPFLFITMDEIKALRSWDPAAVTPAGAGPWDSISPRGIPLADGYMARTGIFD